MSVSNYISNKKLNIFHSCVASSHIFVNLKELTEFYMFEFFLLQSCLYLFYISILYIPFIIIMLSMMVHVLPITKHLEIDPSLERSLALSPKRIRKIYSCACYQISRIKYALQNFTSRSCKSNAIHA